MRTLPNPLSATKRLLSFCVIIALATGPMSALAQENTDCGEVCEEIESGVIASQEKRAILYLKNKEWSKLGELAQKWTRNYPGESQAWNYLGLAQQGAGKAKEANDAFLQAWRLSDKKDFRIIESIGDSYAEIKQWDLAKIAYQRAIDIHQNRAILWHKLVDTLKFLSTGEGWAEEIAPVIKKTLTFREYVNEYPLWQQYAQILDKIDNDTDEQYFAYRNITRIKTRNIKAWERLYEIEIVRENPDEVRKITDILFRLDSKNSLANLYYGNLALKSNLPKKAREYFQIGLSHESVSPKQRANIYMSLGDLETLPHKALPYYRDAAISDPANTVAWEFVIVMLKGLNRRADAEKIYHGLRTVERKLKKDIALTKADAQPLLTLK